MFDKNSRKRLAFLISVIFGIIVVAIIVISVLVTLPRQVTGEGAEHLATTSSVPLVKVSVPAVPEKTLTCDYAHLIGKHADHVSSDQLTGHPMRVVHKGIMVTGEYLEGRVNLHVDDHGVIIAITCG